MTFNDLYDGYLALAEKGYCPVLIPTSEGLFAAVIAQKPSKWLLESCRAVRNMAANNGYEVS